jgi:hypothetical protein
MLNLNNSEIAISDDRLEQGWYRIISAAGTEMQFVNKWQYPRPSQPRHMLNIIQTYKE